mmetsp:Transcript_122118/g.331605  ORF Transcript_122118/g.331605 Transcript_122118/m.331605 type:complete len:211 (+) Transcript_122118:161-793(+)
MPINICRPLTYFSYASTRSPSTAIALPSRISAVPLSMSPRRSPSAPRCLRCSLEDVAPPPPSSASATPPAGCLGSPARLRCLRRRAGPAAPSSASSASASCLPTWPSTGSGSGLATTPPFASTKSHMMRHSSTSTPSPTTLLCSFSAAFCACVWASSSLPGLSFTRACVESSLLVKVTVSTPPRTAKINRICFSVQLGGKPRTSTPGPSS